MKAAGSHCINAGLVQLSTMFPCRISNIRGPDQLALEHVTLKYWFNGPTGVHIQAESPSQILFTCLAAPTPAGMMLQLSAGQQRR